MKLDPVRYSSAVGESWHHFSFKVKYCHQVFDIMEIREECKNLLIEAFERNELRYKDLGFDSNHVHGMVDIGLRSRPDVAKRVRGYVGKKIFETFPAMKRTLFWGSGFWNLAYWMDAVGKDMEFMENYVRNQRYFVGQSKLEDFAEQIPLVERHAASL